MSKRAIWAIIILMSTALIGIIIIQLYWIRWSVQRNEAVFDDKIALVLGIVQQKVETNSDGALEAFNYFKKSNQSEGTPISGDIESLLSDYDPYTKQRLMFEIRSMEIGIDPSRLLENINPKDLDGFVTEALREQQILTKYDYGVYSNESEDFIIVNGVYNAVIGETSDKSTLESKQNKNLYNSEFRIPLFASEFETPGYLKISFPNKLGWLWSSVLPSLISSIIFTGLILFCFSYTIYVILRQKKVSAMKTDFINNMTHEFKTPIATISLASDSITSPAIISSPDKIKRFSSIIKEENNRMLSQVEKVLQMALLDKKDFSLNLDRIDIHEIIKTAVGHSNLRVKDKEGSVSVDFKAENSEIEGDRTHISNIIHNLLDNAIKYSPKKPTIKVSTKNKLNGIEMVVSDNGIGMSKEARKQIFDKFYRVHTGNLHNVKGFGLGLSYVKAIVTAHKGRINVQSDLGKGSQFFIYLPHKINVA